MRKQGHKETHKLTSGRTRHGRAGALWAPNYLSFQIHGKPSLPTVPASRWGRVTDSGHWSVGRRADGHFSSLAPQIHGTVFYAFSFSLARSKWPHDGSATPQRAWASESLLTGGGARRPSHRGSGLWVGSPPGLMPLGFRGSLLQQLVLLPLMNTPNFKCRKSGSGVCALNGNAMPSLFFSWRITRVGLLDEPNLYGDNVSVIYCVHSTPYTVVAEILLSLGGWNLLTPFPPLPTLMHCFIYRQQTLLS